MLFGIIERDSNYRANKYVAYYLEDDTKCPITNVVFYKVIASSSMFFITILFGLS